MRSAGSIPVLVFDLDGTILRCNSFPLWVIFLLIGQVSGLGPWQRLLLSVHTMRLLLSRKLFRLSHDELQRRLQIACAGECPVEMDRFVARLLRRVRHNLQPLLVALAECRFDAVLATAAAADYAEPLGRQLGFRYVLATCRDRIVGSPANAGSIKRQNVAAFVCAAGWHARPLILFTDHLDDLPLMQDSAVVCWFGSTDMLAKARLSALQAEFIDCRDMTGEGVQEKVLRLCGYQSCSNESSRSAMTVS